MVACRKSASWMVWKLSKSFPVGGWVVVVVGGLHTHNLVKPTSTWLWLSWVLTIKKNIIILKYRRRRDLSHQTQSYSYSIYTKENPLVPPVNTAVQYTSCHTCLNTQSNIPIYQNVAFPTDTPRQ